MLIRMFSWMKKNHLHANSKRSEETIMNQRKNRLVEREVDLDFHYSKLKITRLCSQINLQDSDLEDFKCVLHLDLILVAMIKNLFILKLSFQIHKIALLKRWYLRLMNLHTKFQLLQQNDKSSLRLKWVTLSLRSKKMKVLILCLFSISSNESLRIQKWSLKFLS